MLNNFFKKINFFSIPIFFLILVFSFLLVSTALAEAQDDSAASAGDLASKIQEQNNQFNTKAGYTSFYTAEGIVAAVIAALLGLLGIIFVSLMVYAGYNWMTANGEEEKIELAKKTIKRAIIGAIITVSAYAITAFVFRNLPEVGSEESEGGGSAPSIDGTGG